MQPSPIQSVDSDAAGPGTAEVARARQYLEQTRDGVMAAAGGLSEAQWKFKPAPGRWSVAENVEHIVLTQELVLGPVCRQLAAAPPPAAGYNYREVDDLIVAKLPDRSRRFPGPDILRPSGSWSETEAFDRLRRDCALLVEHLESTPGLRQHSLEAAPLRAVTDGRYTAMDGYQWMLAIAAHTERHSRQILEVKGDPGFPAR